MAVGSGAVPVVIGDGERVAVEEGGGGGGTADGAGAGTHVFDVFILASDEGEVSPGAEDFATGGGVVDGFGGGDAAVGDDRAAPSLEGWAFADVAASGVGDEVLVAGASGGAGAFDGDSGAELFSDSERGVVGVFYGEGAGGVAELVVVGVVDVAKDSVDDGARFGWVEGGGVGGFAEFGGVRTFLDGARASFGDAVEAVADGGF